MKAPSSSRKRSAEASLSLAREGSGPSLQQQERVGRALRDAGLTVPLLVAPILANAAAATAATTAAAATSATTASSGTATSAAVTSTAANGAAGTSAATTSAAVTGSAGSAAGTLALGSKLVAGKLLAGKLVVALAVAGAGTFGLSAGYKSIGRTPASAPPAAMSSSATMSTAMSSRGVDDEARTQPTVSPSSNGAPTLPVPTESEARAIQPSGAGVKSALNSANAGAVPRVNTTPNKTEDRLVVEMQRLKEANRALSAGSPRLAIQRLDALDRELPSGALTQERRVSRVLALCALGNTEQAITLTRQLLRQNDSFYRTRLEHSCGSP